MGASETSVFPDNNVVLVDAAYTRAYVNGAWEPRGALPDSAVVIWIKPTTSTPDPDLNATYRKAQDAIVTANPLPQSSLMYVVNHGADANTARPTGVGAVYWIGTVEPANSINGDLWLP